MAFVVGASFIWASIFYAYVYDEIAEDVNVSALFIS